MVIWGLGVFGALEKVSRAGFSATPLRVSRLKFMTYAMRSLGTAQSAAELPV
jgi:hypothetical protein